jgi:valyl-tRNA synthetase
VEAYRQKLEMAERAERLRSSLVAEAGARRALALVERGLQEQLRAALQARAGARALPPSVLGQDLVGLPSAEALAAAGADLAARAESRATAAWVLDVILKLLHPVMPFLTEELWDQTADLGTARTELLLISARWPDLSALAPDPAAAAEVGLVIAAIAEGRSVRSELNVPLGARPPLLVVEADAAQSAILAAYAPVIGQMLRVSEVRVEASAPTGAIPFVVQGATLALPVAEFIDLAAEKARLAKEIAGLAATAEQTRRKLDNPDFVARAPEEVVEENRERLAEAEAARERLQAALARLS